VTEPFRLAPAAGVVLQDGRTVALARDAWLKFCDPSPFKNARFVEIVYRASLFDEPIRPVLRFVSARGQAERVLPGPVAGAGLWRGAVPRGVEAVFISPCARAGRFDFRVESVRRLSHFDMAALVWRRRREKLWSIALASAFGYLAEAERAMDWAIGGEPPENFDGWRARRARALDLEGMDAPRRDWSDGPRFLVLIEKDDAEPQALARTKASLESQAYRSFAVAACGRADRPLLAQVDFICRLRAGDELAPHALALVAEEAARSENVKLYYADEVLRAQGREQPLFKPGWSPIFARARPYLGRAVFVQPELLGGNAPDAAGFHRAALAAAPAEVRPLRRLLLTRAEDDEEARLARESPASAPKGAPLASVIVLTRDRGALLKACLDSLLARSTYPNFELVIVDNGTTEGAALEILRVASCDPRVRVLERPEPFNFAGFNNDAARAARGDVLVFLNNDTEVLAPDWLERLCAGALDPTVGAVGGLLLFPDGQVQHSGVVVGLGEEAGHFEALLPPDAPSWLGRNLLPHETSAVTGACLAVERRKFEAVGGFDAESFPVESNDVDLCLRLAARGWPALYLPAARLLHRESASRGGARTRPMSVYAREREEFRRRWSEIIRDDPYFHPGLSLYSRRFALG